MLTFVLLFRVCLISCNLSLLALTSLNKRANVRPKRVSLKGRNPSLLSIIIQGISLWEGPLGFGSTRCCSFQDRGKILG